MSKHKLVERDKCLYVWLIKMVATKMNLKKMAILVMRRVMVLMTSEFHYVIFLNYVTTLCFTILLDSLFSLSCLCMKLMFKKTNFMLKQVMRLCSSGV